MSIEFGGPYILRGDSDTAWVIEFDQQNINPGVQARLAGENGGDKEVWNFVLCESCSREFSCFIL